MEYADGGDLSLKIKEHREQNTTFSEDKIIDYFSQIWEGIKYCHDKKIFHRDIKSQNIFLTSKEEVSKSIQKLEGCKTLVLAVWDDMASNLSDMLDDEFSVANITLKKFTIIPILHILDLEKPIKK